MQNEHSELWERANALVQYLKEIQNCIVELLPIYKNGLPKTIKELDNKQAQTIFLDYIKCRILYAFAEEVWSKTEQLCKDIAMNQNNNNSAKETLEQIFEIFGKYPLLDIIKDEENGYDTMNEMIEKYHTLFGSVVFVNDVLPPGWKYNDIAGVLENIGLKNSELWKDALAAQDPTGPSVGELLSDDKPVRFY